MLNSLSKKEKLLVSIVIVIGVIAVYFNFIFVPSIKSIKDKNVIIEDYNKQIQIIADTKSKNNKLKVELVTLQAKSDETSKQLPYSERIPEIARNIKPLVDSSGVTFGPIGFGKAAEYLFTVPGQAKTNSKVRLMSLSVSLSETGDYPSLMKLIDSIETNGIKTDKRIAAIDTVAFSPSGTSLQATIGLHYYFLTGSKENVLKYEFVDSGVYGKDNPFK